MNDLGDDDWCEARTIRGELSLEALLFLARKMQSVSYR